MGLKKKFKFIPSVDQNLIVMLTGSIHDFGFFDSTSSTGLTGSSPTVTVTGFSASRLSELRKYTVSGPLGALYVTSNISSTDGLDLSLSFTGVTASTYVYYIGGITYTDKIVTPETGFTTTFSFLSLNINDPNNFDQNIYIKDENKQNLVEKLQVNSDVFIDRQEQSVFERNYRLRSVGTLNNVLTYAGGNYFTVYNNT